MGKSIAFSVRSEIRKSDHAGEWNVPHEALEDGLCRAIGVAAPEPTGRPGLGPRWRRPHALGSLLVAGFATPSPDRSGPPPKSWLI